MLEGQKAYDQFVAAHPEQTTQAEIVRKHYLDEGFETAQPLYLRAILHLMEEPGFDRAASALARATRSTIMQGENNLIRAVNNGPACLKEDEDFLHGKGVMRGADRYYLGFKGIHLGGTYDRAWQAADPAYRPIMAEAVTAAISKKGKSIERRTLKYVAVLLMPEGESKLFLLNKLSIRSEKKHGAHVREACDFIRRKANELGIAVSETLLANKAAERKVLPKIPASADPRRSQKETRPVSPEFTGGAAAPKEKAQAVQEQDNQAPVPSRDIVKLKRDLKTLERRNKISEKEGKIYFWLKNDSDEEPRTIEDAARKSGKEVGKIRIIVAKINVALRQMEDASVDASLSDGNLHKAGTVRPK